jgi:hypothetical protein
MSEEKDLHEEECTEYCQQPPSREQEPTNSIIIKYNLPLALKNVKELMLMLKKRNTNYIK